MMMCWRKGPVAALKRLSNLRLVQATCCPEGIRLDLTGAAAPAGPVRMARSPRQLRPLVPLIAIIIVGGGGSDCGALIMRRCCIPWGAGAARLWMPLRRRRLWRCVGELCLQAAAQRDCGARRGIAIECATCSATRVLETVCGQRRCVGRDSVWAVIVFGLTLYLGSDSVWAEIVCG